jgi:hypothetical protein
VWGNTFGASAASINLNLSALVINHRQAKLMWDSVTLFSSYRLEYRAQNYSPQWYPVTTTDNATRLTDLTAQRTYEARVQGIMPNGQPGAWSDIVTFTTPAEAIIACGQTSPAPSMQNYKPLTAASIGQTWQIGQFEMLVTQLQSISNAQGYYSGLGKIKMFGVVGVACSFQAIRMNEELQMVAGEVHALTDGIDNWLSQANAGNYQYDTSYFYSGTIDSIYVNGSGQVVIVDVNGTTTIVNIDLNGGVLFTDANGNQWVVNQNGTVTIVGDGVFLPPSDLEPLSALERTILKRAIDTLKTDYSQTVLGQQLSSLTNAKNTLTQQMQNQRQNILPGSTAIPEKDKRRMGFVEIPAAAPASTDQTGQSNLNYKNAEYAYNTGQIIFVLYSAQLNNQELDIIGSYLLIGSVPFRTFVAQQIAQSQTESQIVNAVAQQGLVPLAQRIAQQKMEQR